MHNNLLKLTVLLKQTAELINRDKLVIIKQFKNSFAAIIAELFIKMR